MKNNYNGAMVELHFKNSFTCLWKQLTTSQIIVPTISKYIKLAKEIAIM